MGPDTEGRGGRAAVSVARVSTIVLLPAIAGVNDYIRGTAARLKAAGYRVEIVDYFAGSTPPDVSTPEKIAAAVESLPDAAVLGRVRSVLERLRRSRAAAGARVGLLGFCIGGMYAMLAACELEGIAAAANYYGTIRYASLSANKPVSPIDRIPALRAPLLAHYGTADRFVPWADVEALERRLTDAGKPFELFRYRGAPHAFDEDFRPAWRPVAAREAWSRTLTFLDWHLRGRCART